jgi:hypothetical protein
MTAQQTSVLKSASFIWLSISFVLIVLFATAPLISAFIGGGIAESLGCTVTEGVSSPCLFRGSDVSETLSVMFVLGWFAFETLPLGALLLAIWLIVACIVVVIKLWRRRRREA